MCDLQITRNRRDAGALFFPLASLYALLAVPLWLAMGKGWLPLPDPLWHGHEMLFGYALAVVAGYLIQRPSPRVLWTLLGLWLSARIAAFAAHPSASVLSLAFASLLAWLAVPPFLKAAKKFQNRAFAPLLAAFALGEGVFQAGAWLSRPELRFSALLLGIDLFAFLLIMMGGRAIAPAMAGHLHRKGHELEARVQPNIEKTLIVTMAAAIALELTPWQRASGGLLLIAALLVAVRILRWQPWRALDAPPLWTLLLGYLWLVPGLALKGYAQLLGLPPHTPLHGIAIGALGTLTLAMMARTDVLRRKKSQGAFHDIGIGVLLISASALLRLGGWIGPAAMLWSLAFLILLLRLLRP